MHIPSQPSLCRGTPAFSLRGTEGGARAPESGGLSGKRPLMTGIMIFIGTKGARRTILSTVANDKSSLPPSLN